MNIERHIDGEREREREMPYIPCKEIVRLRGERERERESSFLSLRGAEEEEAEAETQTGLGESPKLPSSHFSELSTKYPSSHFL